MFRLIVLLETVVRRENVLRDYKVSGGRAEGPEVRAKDQDGEGEIAIIWMRHLHLLLESTSEILA